MATDSRGKLACALKTLPVLRWQAVAVADGDEDWISANFRLKLSAGLGPPERHGRGSSVCRSVEIPYQPSYSHASQCSRATLIRVSRAKYSDSKNRQPRRSDSMAWMYADDLPPNQTRGLLSAAVICSTVSPKIWFSLGITALRLLFLYSSLSFQRPRTGSRVSDTRHRPLLSSSIFRR